LGASSQKVFRNLNKAYSHVLIKLSKFAKDWKMTINKTKMSVFNKGGRLKNINIKYNNSSIKCVQKYTYLPLTPIFEDFVLTPKINLQNCV
jgi:hypothetical protein